MGNLHKLYASSGPFSRQASPRGGPPKGGRHFGRRAPSAAGPPFAPSVGGELSPWMQWLMTSHVRRHHRRYGTGGHVWQGRYKSFVIQPARPGRDERAAGTLEKGPGLWTVLRYVERNPLRAGLVERAEDWPWSSLHWWLRLTRPRVKLAVTGLRPDEQRELAEAMPAWLRWNWDDRGDRPRGWRARVKRVQTEQELAAVRRSVERGRPRKKRAEDDP